MMSFKGNGEAGTHSIITTLDDREGKLSLDDSFLYAAQHFGLEVDLGCHKERVWISVLAHDSENNLIWSPDKVFLAMLMGWFADIHGPHEDEPS